MQAEENSTFNDYILQTELVWKIMKWKKTTCIGITSFYTLDLNSGHGVLRVDATPSFGGETYSVILEDIMFDSNYQYDKISWKLGYDQ